VGRYEFGVEGGLDGLLVGGEVEEGRQVAAVGQLVVGLAELVEEGVGAGLEGRDARGGRVLEQLAGEVDGLGRGARPEHLGVGRSSEFTLVYFFLFL